MFPYQIMDKLLKLKLELAYKDMSVEQARQHFSEVTSSETKGIDTEKPVIKRKRIPLKKDKDKE